MITCIVVDDEPLARQLIVSYLDQVPGMHCIGCYQSAVEAFTALHAQSTDVIFIDIEMPGISGLNFVRSLKKPPKLVFITAYAEHAVDAFELDAVDYLIKPVTMERFLKTVGKLIPLRNEAAFAPQPADVTSIFLKVDRRLVRLDLDEIIYIESLGDYLKVHGATQTYITYMPIGKIEALLPAGRFIRIHRSTIVNRHCIRFVEGNFVRTDKTDLPIGLTYRDTLLKSLGILK